MFRKNACFALILLFLMLLPACSPKEAVVSPTPQPTPSLQVSTPSPAPTPEPTPDPVCILEGEEIVSLCDTACFQDAMITAGGKLLVWNEVSFDLEQCLLRQENPGYLNIYELPLENITGAWLGRTSILALDKDGVLWGMGSNVHGQLWNAPEHEGWNTPVKLTNHVVSAAIEGWYYSAAVKDDGGVWLMGSKVTGDTRLSPTQIAKIKGAVDIYGGGALYVRDKTGVSWRLGEVDELLDDPRAVTSEQYSGIRWLREDLWLTDKGELVRSLSNGEKRTLLTDVADVDLAYDIYATAVTKGGDLYVWNEESMEEYDSLIVDVPTKVMEGVKLAGAWEHGVVVVTQADGAVWAIFEGMLNTALTENRLIEVST